MKIKVPHLSQTNKKQVKDKIKFDQSRILLNYSSFVTFFLCIHSIFPFPTERVLFKR